MACWRTHVGCVCLVGLLWGFCFVSHYGPRWLVMRANIFGWLGILFTSLLGWQTFSGHGLLIVVGAHYRVYVQHCWRAFWGWFGVLGVGCW